MKRIIKLCALTCLAALVASGAADAETQYRKRKPTLFEQLLGIDGSRPVQKRNWTSSRERDTRASFFRRKPKPDVADDDPESDPGLGMGNLTYVPPKLVPLSGLALSAPRPADPSAASIYDQLSGEGASLRVLPAARDALLAQYQARGFRPLWLEDGKLSVRGRDVLKLLAAADAEGLQPAAYLPTGLTSFSAPLPEQDAAAMARLDIDLSAAALAYARDASGGQFDPRLLSRYNDVVPPWEPAERTVKLLAFSPFVVDYLKGLNPSHPAYAAMKQELAQLRAEAGTAAEPIAEGPIVKPGTADERIPALRRRLAALGHPAALTPEADPKVLDAALSAELKAFQKASGLKATGAFGPQTLAALNTDRTRHHLDKLLDNMERVRWLPRDLGSRYVFVNQAAFEARVMDGGNEVWKTRVIVGKPNTQTSVFHDEMEFVVFNPSWGVPPSIIAHEYLPKLREDPSYLDRLGFKVVTPQGKVVSSRSIDWEDYGSKVPFGIQQPPGVKNALGELKFLFPNSHNIYMHDTPSRELFQQNVRAFSHGCVRVQNPRQFASVLLGWPEERVAQHVKTPGTETVKLKRKIPVHITYFTAWPDEAGKIAYFDDIYGRDRTMETARSATLVARR